ncbi:uncharacterized protein LOC134092446 isoform X2 [Sardina pilchardus]|uniref:uncharacterized protein LOC134092446 isoform X2 n=1 Tax=Sardina pilchardus TaxID=27697 RepID=UPI002E0E23CD
MAVCRMVCFLYGIILIIHLYYPLYITKAQGSSPTLTASSSILSVTDSVDLSCAVSGSLPLSHCIFSLADKEANKYKVPTCQLSFTGEELLTWSDLVRLPATVRVKCYTADEPSQHSRSVSVSVTASTTVAPPLKPNLKISPAVLRESSTVQMTCEVPQSQSASLCVFSLDGIAAAPYSYKSCHISLSGVQIQKWTHQSSPLEAKVGCYYLTAESAENIKSSLSVLVSLTVLDRLQKPNITVRHDGSIAIGCDIPKHFGEATRCQLYTGDESKPYIRIKTSKSASGDVSCQFTVNEDDLFRRLPSVGSRGVSCDYTVNTEPPSLSPRSDPYNFKVATATETPTATSTLTSTTKIPATATFPSSSGPAVTSTSLRDYSTRLHSTQHAKGSFAFGPWISVPVVALAVGLFLVVLTTACLCSKRHKHTRSLNTTYWRSDSVRFGPNNIKQLDKEGDSSLLAVSETSGADLKIHAGEDVSKACHVYSTIPDTLEVPSRQDTTYSLAQAQKDPDTTQQSMAYSFVQNV